jgi:hypothetical protein
MKLLFIVLFICFFTPQITAQKTLPEKLVQQQLDAYNKRDTEAFLLPYSDSVTVYNYPDKLLYTGKATMRKEYAIMFKSMPDLKCTIKKRMVIGNTVIDEESVVFDKKSKPFRAIAVYTIADNKIVTVRFITN